MKSLLLLIIASVAIISACTKPSEADPVKETATAKSNSGSASGPAVATPAAAPQLNFPTRSQEEQNAIKLLKGGEWVPIKIDRPYLLLRGGGIRFERGDYFVQLLLDANGKVAKLLLTKNRGTQLSKIDLNKATASDGSFAAVLDVVGEVDQFNPHKETKAYVNSSGESASVWVHLAGQRTEWRGELLGYAGSDAKPQTHP